MYKFIVVGMYIDEKDEPIGLGRTIGPFPSASEALEYLLSHGCKKGPKGIYRELESRVPHLVGGDKRIKGTVFHITILWPPDPQRDYGFLTNLPQAQNVSGDPSE